MNETGLHILSTRHFNSLAAGLGDAEAMQALRDGLHNKWLMMLRTIIDSTNSEALTQSVALLDQARKQSHSAFAEMVSYPYVQTWAQACLEQAFGIATTDPLDVHIEHLGAIACVVAFEAGMTDFEMPTTVRNGLVYLPKLGCARFGDVMNDQKAKIAYKQGRLLVECGEKTIVVPNVPESSSDEWLGIRKLAAEHDGLFISVAFDDIDRYRSYYATWLPADERLPETDFAAWKELFEEAWKNLCERHHEYAEAIASGLQVLTPAAEAPYPAAALQARHGFGAILALKPSSAKWLAFCLLEGWQKAKLGALHTLLPLHQASNDRQYYAPWYMVDPRTFQDLCEGIYSLPISVAFWESERRMATDLLEKTEAELFSSLWQSWYGGIRNTLTDSDELSEWGSRLLVQLDRRMQEISLADISNDLWALSRRTSFDRRVSWHLRNLMPDYEQLKQLADAWISTMPCPIAIDLRMKLQSRVNLDGYASRRQLGMIALVDPSRLQKLAQHPDALQATHADVLAAQGELAQAIDHYLQAINDDPRDAEAWAGFILAWHQHNPHDIASVVMHRLPELVYQLHKEICIRLKTKINPLDIAAWLSPLVYNLGSEFSLSHLALFSA